MRRVAALIVAFSLLTVPVYAGTADLPDKPTPRPARDRVTQYRLWSMHQVAPAFPPYTFALVAPGQPPLTGRACLKALGAVFTARKRPQEPAGTQTVMLLQWLSIQPDPMPDYAKWVGCWPMGSPYWVAWQMHRSTTSSDEPGAPPYWYAPWTVGATPMHAEHCLALIRSQTKRRRVELITWYEVKPDPPPDVEKRIGCLPKGFDPEERNAK